MCLFTSMCVYGSGQWAHFSAKYYSGYVAAGSTWQFQLHWVYHVCVCLVVISIPEYIFQDREHDWFTANWGFMWGFFQVKFFFTCCIPGAIDLKTIMNFLLPSSIIIMQHQWFCFQANKQTNWLQLVTQKWKQMPANSLTNDASFVSASGIITSMYGWN